MQGGVVQITLTPARDQSVAGKLARWERLVTTYFKQSSQGRSCPSLSSDPMLGHHHSRTKVMQIRERRHVLDKRAQSFVLQSPAIYEPGSCRQVSRVFAQ